MRRRYGVCVLCVRVRERVAELAELVDDTDDVEDAHARHKCRLKHLRDIRECLHERVGAQRRGDFPQGIMTRDGHGIFTASLRCGTRHSQN